MFLDHRFESRSQFFPIFGLHISIELGNLFGLNLRQGLPKSSSSMPIPLSRTYQPGGGKSPTQNADSGEFDHALGSRIREARLSTVSIIRHRELSSRTARNQARVLGSPKLLRLWLQPFSERTASATISPQGMSLVLSKRLHASVVAVKKAALVLLHASYRHAGALTT